MPTFTTASVPDGPNGPLIPEIHEANPEAIYIPRTGQINAWDNPKWVEAIENTGRKTLIIAGTLTSVCMAFPTLSALAAGYKVFNVVDASGNFSSMATDITLARVVQAGAVPTDTFATLAELMSTWNRPDAMEFAEIMKDHIVPHYQLLFESYEKAQERAKGRPRNQARPPGRPHGEVISKIRLKMRRLQFLRAMLLSVWLDDRCGCGIRRVKRKSHLRQPRRNRMPDRVIAIDVLLEPDATMDQESRGGEREASRELSGRLHAWFGASRAYYARPSVRA